MADLVRRVEDGLSDQVRDLVRASRAASTLAAYRADWRRFEQWCSQRGGTALPATATTVAEYLAHLVARGSKVATIERVRAALGQVHVLQGVATPTKDALVSELLKGIRRTVGVAQREARPVSVEELHALVGAQPRTTELGLRNRALLTLAFMGAFRRSEVVSLDVDDVTIERRGLVVHLRRSKTDQEGRGVRVGMPRQRGELCPVRTFEEWLAIRRGIEGENPEALFVSVGRRGRGRRLSGQAVWRIVREAAVRANVDSERLSAHSLRAGFATAAARAGKPESATMRVTRHKSLAMLLRYVRVDDPLEHAAGEGVLD